MKSFTLGGNHLPKSCPKDLHSFGIYLRLPIFDWDFLPSFGIYANFVFTFMVNQGKYLPNYLTITLGDLTRTLSQDLS